MRVIAIDPGLTTGLAFYTDVENFRAVQTDSLESIIAWIMAQDQHPGTVFIIEDYISSGHLTKQAKHTLKLLGFLEHWISKRLWGKVVLQVPQKRLSSVEQARKMCEENSIEGPHSWDALAHALAYARDLT